QFSKPPPQKKSPFPSLPTIQTVGHALPWPRRNNETIKPNRLTADTIPRTFETPNLSFKIGSRNTPKVAPSFATPAANPPAVPRNCVGNKIGARVDVVEVGPAFIHRVKTIQPVDNNGIGKTDGVSTPGAININMPTAMPAKPIACIRMRPNRGTLQIPSRKPNSKNKSIMPLPSARARSCATRPCVLPEISIDPKITGVKSPTPYVAIS